MDPGLARSLSKVAVFVEAKKAVEADDTLSDQDKITAMEAIQINGITIKEMALDFSVPGYDFELRVWMVFLSFDYNSRRLQPNGHDEAVTIHNVEAYIQEILDVLLGTGVRAQAQAFSEGFSKVFPIADLGIFSADELVMIFGNGEEDWSVESELP